MSNARNKSSLRLGNRLYRDAYWLYRPLYAAYKAWGDRYERALMRERLGPGKTVIDIGSNIGIHTRYLAGLVGSGGRVVAFEPDPVNFSRLQQSVRGLDQVETVQAAVGHESGSLKLYVSDELNVDHRSYDPGGDEQRACVEVPAHRLDDYLGPDAKVDFIKMDIQGAEWFALQGMQGILEHNPDIALVLEFWPIALQQAVGDSEKPVRFLEERGFKVELTEDDSGKRRVPFAEARFGNGLENYYNLFAYR